MSSSSSFCDAGANATVVVFAQVLFNHDGTLSIGIISTWFTVHRIGLQRQTESIQSMSAPCRHFLKQRESGSVMESKQAIIATGRSMSATQECLPQAEMSEIFSSQSCKQLA
mmetsp:Transcript_12198/g.26900  ORF Transcript_12198/g.26900 Transcript_12198/m.26900 type:complete len:112 (+) Transcript_12198:682-1017(+)